LVDGFIELKVHPNDTVGDIKNKIYQKKKWPYDMYDLRILFAEKNLDDKKTLQECDYCKNDGPLVLIKNKKEPKREPMQPEADAEAEISPVKSLMNIGINEETAKNALILCNGDIKKAANLIFEHQSFEEVAEKAAKEKPATEPEQSTSVVWLFRDTNEPLSDEVARFLEEGFKKFDPITANGRHLDLPGGQEFVDFKRMYMASWKSAENDAQNQMQKQYLMRVMSI
tara:strand:+ start:6986 stop:7666 length:681 start_codon:yes stop_codon:yes gene_type:complete